MAVGRAVSRKHAMEMALTGKLFNAGDAERFGLVNRVVAEGQALREAQALARTIAERSAPTLAIGKRTFYAQIERPARRGLHARLAGDDSTAKLVLR